VSKEVKVPVEWLEGLVESKKQAESEYKKGCAKLTLEVVGKLCDLFAYIDDAKSLIERGNDENK